jgi:hypothetical protein
MPLLDRTAHRHCEFAISLQTREPTDDHFDLRNRGLLANLSFGGSAWSIALGEGTKDRDGISGVAVDGYSQRQKREPSRLEGGHTAEVASEHFDAYLPKSVRSHLLWVAGPLRPVASDDAEPVTVRDLG